MSSPSLAGKYAEALFTAAEDSHSLPAVADDLQSVAWVLDSHPGLKKILFHPGIDKAEKYGMITEVFSPRAGNLTVNLLMLLVRKRREPLWDDICALFREKIDDREGKRSVVLETALPLDEPEKKALVSELETSFRKKLVVSTRVNPEVLGGIRIREKLRQIDASAIQFLRSMRNDLSNVKIAPKIQNAGP